MGYKRTSNVFHILFNLVAILCYLVMLKVVNKSHLNAINSYKFICPLASPLSAALRADV